MINYKSLQTEVDTLLRSLGVSASIQRGGSPYTTGYGVFVEKKSEDGASGPTSLLAQTSTGTRVFLLTGTSLEPAPGDYLIVGTDSYYVRVVEIQQPTNLKLLYKLEVSV